MPVVEYESIVGGGTKVLHAAWISSGALVVERCDVLGVTDKGNIRVLRTRFVHRLSDGGELILTEVSEETTTLSYYWLSRRDYYTTQEEAIDSLIERLRREMGVAREWLRTHPKRIAFLKSLLSLDIPHYRRPPVDAR